MEFSQKKRFNTPWIQLLFLSAALALLAGCSGGYRGDLSGARRDVVYNAIAQIGKPYRYGGDSPAEGFDCSGLVRFAYLEAGIKVPRIAAEQQRSARPVKLSRAAPGDLVFFGIRRKGDHVGILIDEKRFVHAPRRGKKIEIAGLDNDYWRKRLTGVGTFLN